MALSFAGEQRPYVDRVAVALTTLGIKHFYDLDHQVTLWGTNQGETLQRIYLQDSSSVIMFISKEYAEKAWPIAERRATLTRAIRERREYVLPVRFDDTVLPGLDPDLGYLRASDYSPERLATAIAEKLVHLGITVPANQGATLGWAQEAEGRQTADFNVTVTDDTETPFVSVDVVAVAANGTYVQGSTNDAGVAKIRLPARRLVTVFAAHSGAAPALMLDHDASNDLRITLPRTPGVGGVIFTSGTGQIPGLIGRLDPIRDPQDRYYLYADNISINEDAHQPHHFTVGVPLALEDASGQRMVVTVLAVIGRTSLLRYER